MLFALPNGRFFLKCRACGTEFEDSLEAVCPECFGPFKVQFDLEKAKETLSRASLEKRKKNLWQAHELLPVRDLKNAVDLGAGWTPLVRAQRLGKILGLDNLWIKNDSVNPSFSFKDRPVATGVARAIELGKKVVSCASTGNLAASTAAYAAKAGLECVVFVPATIEANKISQALAYGAKVLAVNGNYDVANRLANEAADSFGWAALNVNVRPWYAEGEKTLVFETCQQLDWRAPDAVVFPMGSGGLLCEAHKAFSEFEGTGVLGQGEAGKVKFFGAQGFGAGAIVNAFKQGGKVVPIRNPNTIAKSIAMGAPGDGDAALKIIRDSKGGAEDPTDDEIVGAIGLLARTEGIFTEPAGGAALAALKRLAESGKISRGDETVLFITGNGLKTPELVGSQNLVSIEAKLDCVKAVVEGKKALAPIAAVC